MSSQSVSRRATRAIERGWGRGRAWLVLSSALTLLPARAAAQPFSGRVHDTAGAPIAGARVIIDHTASTRTDDTGAFLVDTSRSPLGDVVIATRAGFLSRWSSVDASSPTTGLDLRLESYPADRTGFTPEGPSGCSECHRDLVRGFGDRGGYEQSAHAASALNPRVLDIWRGTASGHTDAAACAAVSGRWATVRDASGTDVDRCYVGIGLLPDLNPQCGHASQPACDDRAAPSTARPTSFSDCAGCHTPGAAIAVPEDLDLDSAETDPERLSVTCAGCHRIAEVTDPDAPGVLRAGRVLRGRSELGVPVGLGPLDDSAAELMATGYAPLFATSLLCAPCHQDTYIADGMSPRWLPSGVPSEQTYAEWLETPYASGARERTCQDCHMPTLEEAGLTPPDGLIGMGGPVRPASVRHVHDFSPRTDAASRATTLALEVSAVVEGDVVRVNASVSNVGVGHAWPSGVTSRNGLLVVTAELDGVRLVASGGSALPLYAGSYEHGRVESIAGATITLDHEIDASALGRELRLWEDTTVPQEHVSWSVLRTLPLTDRGLFRSEARGHFRIVAVRGREVDVEGAPAVDVSGAHFAIGDDQRLAGAAGLGFAKVSIAADGRTNVPFWLATDLVSDNRLAPDETQHAEHRFAIPPGASGILTVHARLIYRKAFVDLAAQRGWDDNEQLAASEDVSVVVEAEDAGARADASTAEDAGARRPDAGAPASGSVGCGCEVVGAASSSTARVGAALCLLATALAAGRRRRRWTLRETGPAHRGVPGVTR